MEILQGMAREDSEPAPVRPSATVVLLREGVSDPEILMVRRRAGDAFGDSYAFPGGVLDHDESDARTYCCGRTEQQADATLALPAGGLDYYSAAVRELFEETGVLLARDSTRNWAFSKSPDGAALIRDLRVQLDGGCLPWAELLRSHELGIACDALHYFSFWETPQCRPKRWSTRFFVAEMPFGQHAQHDGNEVTDSCWMSAAELLAVGEERGMQLPFPTISTLRKFSEFRSVAELLRWAGEQAKEGISKIRPVVVQENGKTRLIVPGDPDYPADEG
jgi:8-oxo-dGTP pyrophosphatase MutT (NUDIX family)